MQEKHREEKGESTIESLGGISSFCLGEHILKEIPRSRVFLGRSRAEPVSDEEEAAINLDFTALRPLSVHS